MRARIAHNIMPLDPSLLPIRMKLAKVPPTRYHMTKWSIDSGAVARSPRALDLSTLRMKLLPLCRGTFMESGVRLLRSDTGGQRVHIPRLRYVSDDPRIRRLMEQARRPSHLRDGDMDDDFLVNPMNLRRIWWVDVDTGDLIHLSLLTNDAQLARDATIYDAVDMAKDDTLARPAAMDEAHRIKGEIEAHQRATNKDGEDAHKAAVEALPKAPSKASLVANKKENREAENAESILGIPIVLPPSIASSATSASQGTDAPAAEPEVLAEPALERLEPHDANDPQQLNEIERSLAERRRRYGD